MKKVYYFGIISIILFYMLKLKFTLGIIVLLTYLFFILLSLFKGISLNEIIEISFKYSCKSKVVLFVFIFVGALTSSWIASGTIPGIVYYGINFINPKIFILFSFLISCFVSFFLGSSFGAASTIGVALMAIARSGNLNPNIVGATILSGIYFGDRWSPLSSSCNLVASLTSINLYDNLKNMIKSMIFPFFITCIAYYFLSQKFVLNTAESQLSNFIFNAYNLSSLTIFIPIISIIIFSLFKINVKISMGVSIFLASCVAFFIQQESLKNIINYLIFGFNKFNGTPLEKIIKGGGIISMIKAGFLIIISCSLIGMFEQLKIMHFIKSKINNIDSRSKLFSYSTLISFITSMIGANQTIAIIMTEQIMEEIYDNKQVKRLEFAKDLENTAVVLAPVIPWNIACYVPCTMLGISSIKFIPFAFYLWLLPLSSFIFYKYISKEKI